MRQSVTSFVLLSFLLRAAVLYVPIKTMTMPNIIITWMSLTVASINFEGGYNFASLFVMCGYNSRVATKQCASVSTGPATAPLGVLSESVISRTATIYLETAVKLGCETAMKKVVLAGLEATFIVWSSVYYRTFLLQIAVIVIWSNEYPLSHEMNPTKCNYTIMQTQQAHGPCYESVLHLVIPWILPLVPWFV